MTRDERSDKHATTHAQSTVPRREALASVAGLVMIYSQHHARLPAAVAIEADVVVGRDPSADLSIPESAISRRHARLSMRGSTFEVTDLGSTNGTWVNGARVEHAVLGDQDVVRLGDSVFRFAASGLVDFAPYAIDGTVRGARSVRRELESDLVGGLQVERLLERVEKIAGTNLTGVVLGESGTGKELVARTIHRASRRGPFQAINCAALPATLLESELFGVRKGAFTGATVDRPGLVKSAHGGTLFLDEIGDLPLEAQAKLLRVLQEREVLAIGATSPERVDVRVVAATHRDLDAEVRDGRFRGDLWARLREVVLRLPPLRERREDLYMLVRHFLARGGRESTTVTVPFMMALAHHGFPYNVRELESALRLAMALSPGELDVSHLPEPMQTMVTRPAAGRAARPDETRRTESEPRDDARAGAPDEAALRASLQRHQGNVSHVAREFGRERMQVHRWMKRFGIDPESYRRGS